ncbi:neuroglian-like [Haliotis rufescens]|uniref:neuroglian-like n=1 Tax=Haliotis rufescens TaxID=6454 RepID=UPI001EAF8F40|nr:neuroglian-like [Haliotis rufescens]XP_046350936.1 neuroglian-like [Haliotis rufescens]XP_046350937.1 neuroglian-like [Haliotis rufescens]XP_046350938.1 neuroglian-like [Haliotis rufescens]XP_046350939.1 neuroglian-like [Haliotis rufescens]XP_046350940.1 neuroglian-like [Haliotis rufescens]
MALTRACICPLLLIAVLHSAQSQNKPPKIIKPEAPQSFDLGQDDSPFNLYCEAEGEPKPRYRWEFDGKPAEGVAYTSDPVTGTLTITGFTEREEGRYQCFAENEAAPSTIVAAMSPVITLRLIMMENQWPDSAFKNVPVTEGSYLKLTCDNQPESVPKAQYTWYHVSGDDTKGDVKNSGRIYTDDKGSLHFMYVLKEDKIDDQSYKCGMFNSRMDIIKLGSEKQLEVTPSNPVPQVKATSQFHTNPAKFLRTQDAELECVFSGNPLPSVTWSDKSNNLITENDKFEFVADSDNRKLVIKNLVEEDEGMYTCKGSNSVGSGETSIFLDVTSGPIWIEALSSQTIPEKKNAVFTCKARPAIGETELNPPVWFRNGNPMPVQNSVKFEFSDNAKVLTVMNLNKETDIMCFQCNVSNNVGYEFGDACLNVIEPIVILSEPQLKQEITKGDIVNLTVTGKTDPGFVLRYRWRFGNNTYEMSPPPHVIYNETSKSAYINTTDLSDEEYDKINGTYYRDLYHAFDSSTVAIEVIVTELPVIVPAPAVAAGMDLWWIALIVALIILIIVIVLITIICNRKRQEGTYPLDKKERANDIDPEKELADSGFHDLSRAPGDDDFPNKKPGGLNPNFDYNDDMDMGDDDESLMEYEGGEFDTKFNEDGSFIGQYTSKNKTPDVTQSPMPLNHNATESQI